MERKKKPVPQERRTPPGEAKALRQQAFMHQEEGRWDEALNLYEAALMQYMEAVGPDDGDTLTIREQLALVHNEKGNEAFADAEANAVYVTRVKLFGLSHLTTLRSAVVFGTILMHSDKVESASKVLESTLKAFQTRDDRDCQEKFDALRLLGYVMYELHRPEDALTLLHRALPGFERSVGPDHPCTLDTKYRMALAHQTLRNYVKAVVLLEEVVKRMEVTLHLGDERWVNAMADLGGLYARMRRTKEAKTTLTRCLQSCANLPMRSQISIQTAAKDLAGVYSSLGDAEAASTVQAWSRGDEVLLPVCVDPFITATDHKDQISQITTGLDGTNIDEVDEADVSKRSQRRH